MSDVATTLLAKDRKKHADPARSNAYIWVPWLSTNPTPGVPAACVVALPEAA